MDTLKKYKTPLITLALLVGIVVFVLVWRKVGWILKEKKDIDRKWILSVTTKQNPEIPWAEGESFARHFEGMKTGFPWVAAVAIDVNGDGHEEVFLGGGPGQDDALLTFRDGQITNVIEGTGLSSKSSTYGGVSVDFNGDGREDLIVARQDGVWLYENLGNGKFKPAQLIYRPPADRVPVALSVADINQDGQLDLYVSNFIQSKDLQNYQFNNPEHAKGNAMLLNQGSDQPFLDITEESGTEGHGNTFTSAFVDLNNDRRPDLVVAQDAAKVEIFKNLGSGKFQPVDVDSGSGFWMGLDFYDKDGDGDMDLFLSNVSGYTPEESGVTWGDDKTGWNPNTQRLNHDHILLENKGDFEFVDVTDKKLGSDNKYGFGWGSVFEDIDLDGREDLLFAVNYMEQPLHKFGFRHVQPVLRNRGAGETFEQQYNFADTGFGHTPLLIDLDRDGVKDVGWINISDRIRFLSNQSGATNSNGHFNVRLPSSARYVNARVELDVRNPTTGETSTQIRENAQGGVGFGSDQSEMHSFGLGPSGIPSELRVKTTYGDQIIKRKGLHRNSTVYLR